MSWRATLALCLITGTLLWVAYRDVITEDPNAGWSKVLEEQRPTPPAQGIERLVRFNSRNVTKITIQRDGSTVESQRTAYGWTGTTNPRAVEEFLDAIALLAVILRIEENPQPEAIQAYGLADGLGLIELHLEDERIRILLGQQNPSATGIYARVEGSNDVILTGAVALWEIEKVVNLLAPATPTEN